jgi:hypothetical protein
VPAADGIAARRAAAFVLDHESLITKSSITSGPGRRARIVGVNYESTFIAVAEDCPALTGEVPPAEHRGRPTAAAVHFAMIHDHPYRYTQEDVQFAAAERRPGAGTHDDPRACDPDERAAVAAAKRAFLDRPQACLRSSPLAKRYGWGLHFDGGGGVAAYPVDSPEYERYAAGDGGDGGRVRVLKAFRSRRG